ncbi:hypothetical protein EB796_012463 [Bugula neritina]|uniref:Uncharacterized protein n=1 Tax=Bugula neritina TaxID=10212 RepID=A0A7J7JTB8_BUGNE|nr:hypothetical protein EB796_012463 [Bugula neritina]
MHQLCSFISLTLLFHLQFDVEYASKNGTGTGELDVQIDTVDGIPLASSYLLEAQAAGTYSANIKVQAKTDPSCDPTQQPCENWLPGNYTLTVTICNGECGSKHPHSQIYDMKSVTFEVSG